MERADYNGLYLRRLHLRLKIPGFEFVSLGLTWLFSGLEVLRASWGLRAMTNGSCTADQFSSAVIVRVHVASKNLTLSSILHTSRLIHWIIRPVLANSQQGLGVRRSGRQRNNHADRLLVTLVVSLQNRVLHVELQRLARFFLIQIPCVKVFALFGIELTKFLV